jgi:drug/metabolite transporter (DMT)-like permease
LRFAIASVVLLALLGGRARLRTLRDSVSLARLAFLALTGIALFTALFNYALVYGSASQGALLYATIPAVVAVCAVVFLKEKLHARRTLGIVFSICGAAVVAASGEPRLDGASAPLLGALLMLSTVFLWGAYTVAAKAIAQADHLAVTFVVCALGALFLIPASGAELALGGLPATSAHGWLGVLYLSLFASAACYVLYQFALRELDASTVGAYTNIDPIVGVLTAIVFLGEGLSVAQLVGAGVVLAGMWLAST